MSAESLLLELVRAKDDFDNCQNGIYLGDNSGERKRIETEWAVICLDQAWDNARTYLEKGGRL